MRDLELETRRRAEARVGQVLRGKWHLDALLGVGGMAAVYAGTHRNGKRGAVKILHAELSVASSSRARFLREGYVANKVGHRGAVSVLDDDTTEDGAAFLVMELLEGTTVDAHLDAQPDERVAPAEVLAIVDQLLDVLVAAHDKGIVHRDLKPENLFLTNEGTVHVLDFGIARLRQPGGSETSTRPGDSMGTPAFMPPEQALGDWDAVDARSDIWAVGATMFTLLTGEFVHAATNVQKMMLAAMTKPARSLASVLPDVPPAVAAIVDHALAQKREDRWASAAEMQAAVRAARRALPFQLGGSSASPGATEALSSAVTALAANGGAKGPLVHTAAPVSHDRPGPRRAKVGIFAAVGAVVVAAAGITFAASHRDHPSGATPALVATPSDEARSTEAAISRAPAPVVSLEEPPPLASASPSASAEARATAAHSASATVPMAHPTRPANPPPVAATSKPPPVNPPPKEVDTTFHGRF